MAAQFSATDLDVRQCRHDNFLENARRNDADFRRMLGGARYSDASHRMICPAYLHEHCALARIAQMTFKRQIANSELGFLLVSHDPSLDNRNRLHCEALKN